MITQSISHFFLCVKILLFFMGSVVKNALSYWYIDPSSCSFVREGRPLLLFKFLMSVFEILLRIISSFL